MMEPVVVTFRMITCDNCGFESPVMDRSESDAPDDVKQWCANCWSAYATGRGWI